MKQKNLILVVVAVVCGLVAAVLTTQMGAKQSTVQEQMVKVPVAARDIPIGTKFKEKDLETMFTFKDFPADSVPPDSVQDLTEITDKTLMQQIRLGTTVTKKDVSATGFIQPPLGKVLMTAPISLDQAAAGFALPGTHVMVICTKKSSKKNLDIVFPLLLDALVLAVDTNSGSPAANANNGTEGTASMGYQQVSMISLAVDPNDAMLLTMAANGAQLRLGLPGQEDEQRRVVMDGFKTMMPTREEIARIFADNWDEVKEPENDPEPKLELVTVLVPTESLESGTQITEEVLNTKFKEMEFPKDHLPKNVASSKEEFANQYLKADLVADVLVAKPYLSATAPVKEVNPVATGGDVAGVKVATADADLASVAKAFVDTTPAPKPKKEYLYVTIFTPQGKKIHQYEKTPKGNKFVKEMAKLEDEDEAEEKTTPRRED